MPSSCVTEGIKVEVSTIYLNDYSHPVESKFLYCYKVTITNESDKWVKLMNRRWLIIDSDSRENTVEGPGVIGKQPELEPGESHVYFSFCELATDFGTMEGSYQMVDKEGKEFNIEVPRFYLATNLSEFDSNKFGRGQIIHHKVYDYRGVIVDYDMYFINDEKWYESNNTQPDKNKPWYYVLSDDTNNVHYVAQENIEASDLRKEISHPLIEFFFNGFDGERYIRNSKTWHDLKFVEKEED